ncbi:hypothetical protein [Halobellus marinus]|uniref:hypothetical protein n=1 Tax=Halobellus TaxID=1073986 RepID=UPI0028B14B17|nr:hypothetical protein [Halobellus sp. DFY28]
MTFPVNPTADDVSPVDLLLELPSRAALCRALAAADIADELDNDDDPERFLDELSQVDLRQAAAQARYAAPQTVHYFGLPGLTDVSPSELDDLTESGGFGGQVRTVEELHDRVYVVCSVPEGGTQAQLSVSEDARVTTVATFDPGTDLLAVRADDSDLAAGTVQALRDHPDLSEWTSVSFRDDGFRGRFEDAAVAAYEQLSLAVTSVGAGTERIDVTGEERGDSGREDVRGDEVVDDLLSRSDTKRSTAQVRLNLRTGDTIPSNPSVRIDFDESSVEFRQWVPEQTLIQLDSVIRQAE